jgi:hypothetical protein
VPPDHRFRSDQKESLLPSGPEPVRQNPEGPIEYRQLWPGMPSLQRCELLAQSQILKKQSAPNAEHPQNGSKKKPKHVRHAMLLQHTACGREGRILLKSQQNRILANSTGLLGTRDSELLHAELTGRTFHSKTGGRATKSAEDAIPLPCWRSLR